MGDWWLSGLLVTQGKDRLIGSWIDGLQSRIEV